MPDEPKRPPSPALLALLVVCVPGCLGITGAITALVATSGDDGGGSPPISLVLERIEPRTGPNNQPFQATIIGSGFEAGARVFVGGVEMQTSQVQESSIKWSDILSQIAGAVPEGNTLNELNIDNNQQTVTWRGVSLTRQSLLALEGGLASLEFLSDLHSPLANLLTPENINFEFSAQLRVTKED